MFDEIMQKTDESEKKVAKANLLLLKFESFFYETKTQTLCKSIINDVDDLYMKLESMFERMAHIIKDIAFELNPPTETDKTRKSVGQDATIVK